MRRQGRQGALQHQLEPQPEHEGVPLLPVRPGDVLKVWLEYDGRRQPGLVEQLHGRLARLVRETMAEDHVGDGQTEDVVVAALEGPRYTSPPPT